jgi:hypothetical protein
MISFSEKISSCAKSLCGCAGRGIKNVAISVVPSYLLNSSMKISGLSAPFSSIIERISPLCLPLMYAKIKIDSVVQPWLPVISLRDSASGRSTGDIFPVVIRAPIIEECMFRYGIQRRILPAIAECLPTRIGNLVNTKIMRILITSILFTACHPQYLGDETGVADLFMLSNIMGSFVEATDSLIVSMGLHGYQNFISLVAEAK